MICPNCNERMVSKTLDKVYRYYDCETCGYIKEINCNHPDSIPAKFQISDGRTQVKLLCRTCNKLYGFFLPQDKYDIGKVYALDKVKYDEYHKLLSEKVTELYAQSQVVQGRYNKRKRNEMTEEYHQYLNTAEWHYKKEQVMKRDNNLCQACLEHKATAVHHLTYKHVYNEPLFDLVAVCEHCHKKIHDIDEA